MIQIESSNDDVYTAKLECNELDKANLQLKQIIIHVPSTYLHKPIENSHAYMKNMAIMNLGQQPSKLKTFNVFYQSYNEYFSLQISLKIHEILRYMDKIFNSSTDEFTIRFLMNFL